MFHSSDVVKIINDGKNAKHKEALAAAMLKEAQTQQQRDFIIDILKRDLEKNYNNYVFDLDWIYKLADKKTDLLVMLNNPNLGNDCLAYYFETGELTNVCTAANFTIENIKQNEAALRYEFEQSEAKRKKNAFLVLLIFAAIVALLFYKTKVIEILKTNKII